MMLLLSFHTGDKRVLKPQFPFEDSEFSSFIYIPSNLQPLPLKKKKMFLPKNGVVWKQYMKEYMYSTTLQGNGFGNVLASRSLILLLFRDFAI